MRKPFLASRPLADGVAPFHPAGVKIGAVVGITGVDAAAFVEPLADGVFLGEVSVGGLADRGWRGEAELLPFEAALHSPGEDTGAFRLQFLKQFGVAFVFRDGDGKRDQMQASADGFVDAVQGWLVVAGDHQLELRGEGEEVLAHVAGGDRIAAGERLEFAFGPALGALGFLGDDEADAAQEGELGRWRSLRVSQNISTGATAA